MGVKKPPYQVVEIKPSLALQLRMTRSIARYLIRGRIDVVLLPHRAV